MNKENRVLAYAKATELKDADLLATSGGNAKLTSYNTTQLTGYAPGPIDTVFTQVWD